MLLVVGGVAVKALGVRLIDSVMPPVVSGAVIVLIGLNQAPVAAQNVAVSPGVAAVTLVAIGLCATLSRGVLTRLSVLVGVVVGWLAGAATGAVPADRIAALHAAAWVAWPTFQGPEFRPSAMLLVLPAVVVVTAQLVGHVKAIGVVTGRDLDCNVGDALIADGLATVLAGAGGGVGVATYTESIGVMISSKVYSTAVYVLAALGALVLSFSPKAAALFATVPDGVIGGVSIVLFGMVALIGVRVWLANKVDLGDPVNLMVAGAAIVAGAGNLTIALGWLHLSGIAWGSLLIVLGYPILRRLRALRREHDQRQPLPHVQPATGRNVRR
jgi:xanthine/uracil permease